MIYLFLNDISTGEVVVILAFILMFFGSKSIPGLARTLGRTMRQIKDATDEIKRDIKQSTMEIEKEFEGLETGLKKNSESISKGLEIKARELEGIAKKFKSTLEKGADESRPPDKPPRKKYDVSDKIAGEEEENKVEQEKESSDEKKEGDPAVKEHAPGNKIHGKATDQELKTASEENTKPDSKSNS